MKNNCEFETFFVYANKFCPRRSLEASKLCRYFDINNLISVTDPKKADLVVIFTCGVFAPMEESSILTIEKSLGEKSAKIVITGCLPAIDPGRLKIYDNALIISPSNLYTLDSLIDAKVPFVKIPYVTTTDEFHDLYHGRLTSRIKRYVVSKVKSSNFRILDIPSNLKSLQRSEETLFSPKVYKLEIAKGCLSNCSYCAIKLASEKFHSFPEEQILEEFKSGLNCGYKDFALIASDVGCYGLDIKTNLPSLLKKLFSVEGDFKIVLWDLNIRWFMEYYEELRSVLKANSMKVSKIVLPIQSGSDRILKLMKRGYEIEKVKKCISDFHNTVPDLRMETHIIVGFPGETDEDFQKTVELIRESEFSKVVVFKYGKRPNTDAASLPDQVSRSTIEKRARILAREDGVIVTN
jgi:tRNA A37 methylthiotransferase MiaB